MIIETERLILKPYELDNMNDYHALMSNACVWTYSTNVPHKNLLQTERKLNELVSRYNDSFTEFHALFAKHNNIFVGEAGILSLNLNANRCVIGYNLLPDFWGKGYATEISKSLIEYAFDELKVERVEALAMKSNAVSCRVLEKSGMTLEGVLRHFTKIQGVYENVCYYSIIASDRAKQALVTSVGAQH